MGKTEEIKVIFRGFSADRRHTLIVGISRRGVHVTEVADARGCFDQPPPAPYLATTAVFSWQEFRGRERCYSGDDGSGCLRQRIVAGAISLIAYYGGDEKWLDDIRPASGWNAGS